MKKISRRSFLAAAGVSAAALALTACGGSKSTATSTATSAAASTAPAGDAAAAASDPKVTLVYAEVNPLDTIVGQSVCNAVPEGILPQLAQKGSSAAQRRIGQRQRGGTAAHPGPERPRRRERGRAFQLEPRLAETI